MKRSCERKTVYELHQKVNAGLCGFPAEKRRADRNLQTSDIYPLKSLLLSRFRIKCSCVCVLCLQALISDCICASGMKAAGTSSPSTCAPGRPVALNTKHTALVVYLPAHQLSVIIMAPHLFLWRKKTSHKYSKLCFELAYLFICGCTLWFNNRHLLVVLFETSSLMMERDTPLPHTFPTMKVLHDNSLLTVCKLFV